MILLLLLLADFQAAQLQPEQFRWCSLPEKACHLQQGQLVTLTRTGALFRNVDGLAFLDMISGQVQALPKTARLPLTLDMPNMDGPAFFTQAGLALLEGDHWQEIDLPMWFDYHEKNPIPGSHHGLALTAPFVFRFADSIWAYQPKDGSLIIFEKGSAPQTSEEARKMIPVPLANQLLWIDAPKEGRLGLNASTRHFRLQDQISVKHLSRHSLVIPCQSGAWLITFADGTTDVLRGWRRGSVEVTVSYVSVHEQRLSVAEVPTPELPVVFLLESTSSGSPKLKVSERFKALPVHGTEDLALLLTGNLHLLSPSGLTRRFALDTDSEAVTGFSASGQDLWMLSPNGFDLVKGDTR